MLSATSRVSLKSGSALGRQSSKLIHSQFKPMRPDQFRYSVTAICAAPARNQVLSKCIDMDAQQRGVFRDDPVQEIGKVVQIAESS